MEKSVREEVLTKVDELLSLIKSSSNYKRYQEVSLQMKNNEDIMSMINYIKKIQKEIVNLEYRKKDVSTLEKEISINLDKLNSYPIYQEFSYLQKDLDDTFQGIKFILEEYINSVIK